MENIKNVKIVLIIITVIVIVLFTGVSILIGTQVFVGSTQLVTNEGTKGVTEVFWEEYDFRLYSK